MAEARTVVEYVRGKFFAEGTRVMKEGDTTLYSDHSRGINLTVPVCEIWEHLKDREAVAEMVAAALNAQADKT